MNSDTYQIFIGGNYSNHGKLFTDADFRDFDVKTFLEKHKDEETKSEFKRFNHFMNNFKDKVHNSSKTPHRKRRFIADWQKEISIPNKALNMIDVFP